MESSLERSSEKAADALQGRIAEYARNLDFNDLSPEAVHAAKARVIDTLGVLIGGFFGEPCRIARDIAAQMQQADGATLLGTRIRTTPDMAAFANATSARYLEYNDIYHFPGSVHCHTADIIPPALAAAEHGANSGRDFITAVVLGYEVACRMADVFHNANRFDDTNFYVLAAAVSAGKLFGLGPQALAHCVAMAVVPNVILRQVRRDHISVWKEVTAGHAGRAGVFAALLARAGMEGPHMPFEGKAGWCAHIAEEKLSLSVPMGGGDTPFRILESRIRHRPAMAETISSILAAEKLGPVKDIGNVKSVIVETNAYAKRLVGSNENRPVWNPGSREVADHSIPYVVAATLMDGVLTVRSFREARLWDPQLRALMEKIEVLENPEFNAAYQQWPRRHRGRITLVMNNGERRIADVEGGDQDDVSSEKSDAQIEVKFRSLTEEVLGSARVSALLDRLWNLETQRSIAEIPPAFAFA